MAILQILQMSYERFWMLKIYALLVQTCTLIPSAGKYSCVFITNQIERIPILVETIHTFGLQIRAHIARFCLEYQFSVDQ